MRNLLRQLKNTAKETPQNLYRLYLVIKDRRTPMLARVLAILVVAYAISPIDLIPDFIPVLGLLDDLILVPLGIWLVIKLIPDELWQEYKAKKSTLVPHARKLIWLGIFLVLAFWLGLLALVVVMLL
ncbi:MAG: DUF1232 domain-containing protein [Hahellaceae bacterium]|jgi:uncharacterized membrane protein YkvA (DUF1232 family)|nr:DUF1232 domain-containing protein [Hahellaceae bacterium]MCP5211572.1 DUF1232 domain-containing protein [Hahellaceae bacterium]